MVLVEFKSLKSRYVFFALFRIETFRPCTFIFFLLFILSKYYFLIIIFRNKNVAFL